MNMSVAETPVTASGAATTVAATAPAEQPTTGMFSVLDQPPANPIAVLGGASPVRVVGTIETPFGTVTRLSILDHPDVAPKAAEIAAAWGNLTQAKSSLDVIKFGAASEANIEQSYAAMNAQTGDLEAHVFLAVANKLMSGAEGHDAELAKIEAEAATQFKRPALWKLLALVWESKVKEWERERLPQIEQTISGMFKNGGARINSWIEEIKVETENACLSQIEGIRRQELEIERSKEHEVLLAATMSAGYQVLENALAAVPTLPELNRKDQLDKAKILTQRLIFLGNLYSDAPGRLVRCKIGLNSAVESLTAVMSNAMSFFISLRQSAQDLTNAYRTRALQQGNAELGRVAMGLQRRAVQVQGEVAVAAVGMVANAAKQQAETANFMAGATKKMVDDLKAAEQAAKEQLSAASKELADGQRLMLELRKRQNMAA